LGGCIGSETSNHTWLLSHGTTYKYLSR
jgi:hypothetical protein